MSAVTSAIEPVEERLEADITSLAEFTDTETRGCTRTVFSEPYRASRDWLRGRMVEAGLDVHADSAGNLVGVLPGREPAAAPLMTGSHTDTVEQGGRFDGAVGVLGALELVRCLRETGTKLDRDLYVVDFLGEESNSYGLSCLGSRALAGELTTDHLSRHDHAGVALGDRYTAFGLDAQQTIDTGWARRRPPHRYVELHIEQGPLLEERGAQVGVVTAIAGIERLLARFTGRADHAGTMPMGDRRDALVAAAEAVLAIRREGCGAPVHGVSTTSHLDTASASPNVVPADVGLRAEIRSTDSDWLTAAKERLAVEIRDKATEYGVDVDFAWSHDNDVQATSRPVHDTISAVCTDRGLRWEPVPSGATHDAVHLARLCPMGMIFVPSRDGRSHCPEEHTAMDEIITGVQVLGDTLLNLDLG